MPSRSPWRTRWLKRAPYAVATAAVLTLLAASCSPIAGVMDVSAQPGVDVSTSTPPAPPSARLSVFDDGVQAGSPIGVPTSAYTGSLVAAGDVVTTDATGFAALELVDGSVVRLDAKTQIQVTGLAAGGSVLVEDTGRTWHRVSNSVGTPQHRVVTAFGQITGASAGAVFSLDCSDDRQCIVSVFDGTVIVIPTAGAAVTVEAFQRLVLTASVALAAPSGALPGLQPATLPVDAIVGDGWANENLALDAREVTPPLIAVTPSMLEAATVAGKWSIDTVVVSSDNPGTPPGTQTHRDWEFGSAQCGDLCTMPVTRSFGDAGKEASETVAEHLIYGTHGFQAYRQFVEACTSESGAEIAADAYELTSTYDLHVTAIEIRGGIPVATRLEGTASSTIRLAAAAADTGCTEPADAPDRYTVTGVLVTPATRPEPARPPDAQKTPLEAAGAQQPSFSRAAALQTAVTPSVLALTPEARE